MTDLYAKGAEIRGEKILYCFGKVTESLLSRRGWARVQRPLKRSTSREPRERDKISCKSARYLCLKRKERGKVPCGSHRCFQGYLIGDAVCTIQTPLPNIPGIS